MFIRGTNSIHEIIIAVDSIYAVVKCFDSNSDNTLTISSKDGKGPRDTTPRVVFKYESKEARDEAFEKFSALLCKN